MKKTKRKPDPEIKIGEAALRLIARQGWNRVTLDAVAKAAKISAADVEKILSDKNDLLPVIIRTIDAQMRSAFGKPDSQAPAHDRLFEILMARIDILQANRRAITGIMDAAKRDPRMIRKLLPAHVKSMKGILDATGITPPNSVEPLIITGIFGIYGLTLCVWRNDSSPDMSKTMAALDRYLRRVTSIFDILFRQKSRS